MEDMQKEFWAAFLTTDKKYKSFDLIITYQLSMDSICFLNEMVKHIHLLLISNYCSLLVCFFFETNILTLWSLKISSQITNTSNPCSNWETVEIRSWVSFTYESLRMRKSTSLHFIHSKMFSSLLRYAQEYTYLFIHCPLFPKMWYSNYLGIIIIICCWQPLRNSIILKIIT